VTDPHPLTDADLLAWAVVLEYRRQQQQRGMKILLLSFPPCPTCGREAHEVKTWWTREPVREDIRINIQPCGHAHWATFADVERIHHHLAAMLHSLEWEGRHIDAIMQEAQARVGSAQASAGETAATEATELARLRVGEEPLPEGQHPATASPAQWLWLFNEATPEERLAWAGRIIDTSEEAAACFFENHTDKIERLTRELERRSGQGLHAATLWPQPCVDQIVELKQQIDRVRKVIAERRIEVSEREPGGIHPLGTPGASWCDAVTVTCDRVEDALRVFPPAVGIPCPPEYDSGPLEKAGE
jgi:hypothetical protein